MQQPIKPAEESEPLNPVPLNPAVPADWLRPLRYLYRLPLLLLHVLVGLPLTLLMIYTGAAVRPGGDGLDQRAIRYWSRGLCRVFGLRVRRYGTPLAGPVMLVANHLSWIDIQVIHAQRAVTFVGKSEIAGWPLFGWMARAGGTIFLKRGSADSLNDAAEQLAEKLSADHSVAIFPEAGTGTGRSIRRFHGRLLKAAILADKPIQPVALRFVRNGRHNLSIPFTDSETLIANMLRILGQPVSEAQLHFLDPIEHKDQGRREIAMLAQQAVSTAYHEGIELD